MNIDLLAASGHKIYGPKGIGFLYMRRKPEIKLKALIDGGSHEYGFRSGTVAIPLAIGLAKAVEIYGRNRIIENRKLTILKNQLLKGIKGFIPDVIVNSSSENCLPHTLNLTIPDVDAETLLLAIGDEVACSTGSACSSSTLEPSHVLKAIGLNAEKASSTIRLSVGRFNTDEELQFAVENDPVIDLVAGVENHAQRIKDILRVVLVRNLSAKTDFAVAADRKPPVALIDLRCRRSKPRVTRQLLVFGHGKNLPQRIDLIDRDVGLRFEGLQPFFDRARLGWSGVL